MSVLVIMVVAAVIYLICDMVNNHKFAAVQELSRLMFAVSALAWLLGGR